MDVAEVPSLVWVAAPHALAYGHSWRRPAVLVRQNRACECVRRVLTCIGCSCCTGMPKERVCGGVVPHAILRGDARPMPSSAAPPLRLCVLIGEFEVRARAY